MTLCCLPLFGCSLTSVEVQPFLGYHVGDGDAFSGCARLPPHPADAWGVFWGKAERHCCKHSQAAFPFPTPSHLSTICFRFASAVLLVNIHLKRPGHGKLGKSPLPAPAVRDSLLLPQKMRDTSRTSWCLLWALLVCRNISVTGEESLFIELIV